MGMKDLEWASETTEGGRFQYPKVGSMGMKGTVMMGGTMTCRGFSTLKSGRWG